jgi:cell division protein FtsB
VGILKELALAPVAPLRFTGWVIDQVAQDVDRSQNSPQARMQRLRQIEAARDRGELNEDQAARLEAQIIEEASGPQPVVEKEGGQNG